MATKDGASTWDDLGLPMDVFFHHQKTSGIHIYRVETMCETALNSDGNPSSVGILEVCQSFLKSHERSTGYESGAATNRMRMSATKFAKMGTYVLKVRQVLED